MPIRQPACTVPVRLPLDGWISVKFDVGGGGGGFKKNPKKKKKLGKEEKKSWHQ